VYSKNCMKTVSEIGEKAERIGLSGSVFTLGTVNFACSGVFCARILGNWANPLKYTDSDGREDEDPLKALNTINTLVDLNVSIHSATEKIGETGIIFSKGASGGINGIIHTLAEPGNQAALVKSMSKVALSITGIVVVGDAIVTGIKSKNIGRGAFKFSRNIASAGTSIAVSHGLTALMTTLFTGGSGGALTVPGAAASAGVGITGGIIAGAAVDMGLGMLEDAYFGKMK
jgi:hypothetical protein